VRLYSNDYRAHTEYIYRAFFFFFLAFLGDNSFRCPQDPHFPPHSSEVDGFRRRGEGGRTRAVLFVSSTTRYLPDKLSFSPTGKRISRLTVTRTHGELSQIRVTGCWNALMGCLSYGTLEILLGPLRVSHVLHSSGTYPVRSLRQSRCTVGVGHS
jgi:hypothetical protein